jgi:hypothetical protein
VSNEDYSKDGTAPPEEKAERSRIYREAAQAKLSSGTVHVYILAPDGHCIDSQHVATASKVDELTRMLERTIARLKTPAGKLLVKPAPQSAPVKAGSDALVLHLTARNLVRKGNDYAIPRVALGETKAANWGAYPGENWITLQREEWTRFLPPGSVKPGASWEVDRDIAARVLNYFYPSTENNDIKTNQILEEKLRATVISIKDNLAQVRLDGSLKMKHPFYHKDDDQVVEASVVGFLEFESDKHSIRSFQMVTDQAVYGKRSFGVAVRLVN